MPNVFFANFLAKFPRGVFSGTKNIGPKNKHKRHARVVNSYVSLVFDSLLEVSSLPDFQDGTHRFRRDDVSVLVADNQQDASEIRGDQGPRIGTHS
jgi:hypothetical protein